jgi:1-acyl-sn-glycerol-3-phosphate acyltransferase
MPASLRFALRLFWLTGHLLIGLLLVATARLAGEQRLPPEPLTQWWNQRLFGIFGIRIRVTGRPVTTGHLTVANHVSWLDISLIAACEHTRFVSKSEVRHWPVVGSLATAAGTFYLRRGKGGSRPLILKLIPYLQRGGSLTLFPEGTTTTGESVLPFHSRLFAAALEAGRPVQPVAIRYGRSADGRNLAPYVGDDTLLMHIITLLRNPGLDAEVTYLPPLSPSSLDRDELAQAAHGAILKALQPGQPRLSIVMDAETRVAA